MKWSRLFSPFLPLIVIATVVVIFFSPHLFPPRVYVAGDFGGSDFTGLFWPLKQFLSQSLRWGKLPLWSDLIGSGFPTLGEGEIQLFSPTTLLFKYLPLPLAFQLTALLAFLVNGLGVFFLCRELNCSSESSLIAAIAFMLAAPFVLGLEHLTIVTTAAYLPWAWLTVLRWAKKTWVTSAYFWPEGVILAIIWSWQFFQASPQITLLTIFSSSFLFLILTWPEAKGPHLISGSQIQKIFNQLSYLILALVLSLALGSIQILPSWEMRHFSNRAQAYNSDEQVRFSMTGKRLVNFIIPFALLDPSQPPAYFRFGEGPLLWETNGYVGLTTLFFGIAGLLFSRQKVPKTLSWLLILSLLLSFGPRTPVGKILQIFPFSAFRVPGRFLILVDLCLVIAAASFLSQKLIPAFRKVLPPKMFFLAMAVLIFILAIDLFYYAFGYNVSVPAEKILKRPKIANWILRDKSRYLNLAGWYVYNTIYLEEGGWRGKGEAYLVHQETLFPNINLLYGVPGVSSYAGMKVDRSDKLDLILQSYFNVDPESYSARVHYAGLESIFTVTATRYLISPFYVDFPYPPIGEIATPYPNLSLLLYRLPQVPPRAWFSSKGQHIPSENHLQQLISPGYLAQPKKLKTTTFVERPLNEISPLCPQLNTADPKIIPQPIVKSSLDEVIIEVNAPNCGLVVLADTFYPGWVATLDGKPQEIFRANFNFRAVPVLAGKHTLVFKYKPQSFLIGSLVSISSWMAVIALSIYKLKK